MLIYSNGPQNDTSVPPPKLFSGKPDLDRLKEGPFLSLSLSPSLPGLHRFASFSSLHSSQASVNLLAGVKNSEND